MKLIIKFSFITKKVKQNVALYVVIINLLPFLF